MNARFVLLGLVCLFIFSTGSVNAQQFPGEDENIPFLVTFGKTAPTSWGDDDHSQSYFFVIPETQKDPVYIRVFDAECGGENDEMKTAFNTRTKFAVYGGKGAFTNEASIKPDPVPGHDAGTLLDAKTFATDAKYDNQWYTFGPFNPTEGELVSHQGGYIFKMITTGVSGDDGNLYKYFLSTKADRNVPVEGANAFTYEYSFRLPNKVSVCHIYPYVTQDVIAVQQHNFDWDSDGTIRIVSVAKKGEPVRMSSEDNWADSRHEIVDEEKNTSLDFQLIKTKAVRNNNVVFRVTNQYGKAMPFYSAPIGGVPKYKYSIGVKYLKK